jgi:hypothetical protein
MLSHGHKIKSDYIQPKGGKGDRLTMYMNFGQFRSSYLLSFLVAFVLVIGPVLVPAHTVYAAGNTYYVAKNGSNSNPGTLSQPWLTIQKAASTVKAGDTVYVRAGTYYEWVIVSNSGSAGNPITFAAYPGEYPILDASAIPDYGYPVAVFNIWNSAYVSLKGFEIRNNPLYQGVYVYGDSASNIILQNLKIHGTADSGILIVHDWGSPVPAGTIPNVTIDGCEVYDTNRLSSSQEPISFVGVSNFEVKNSKIHDTNNLKEGLTLKPGTNGSVHDNEMYNTKIGIYIDSNSTNVNVYNNNIHNCYSAGIAMGAEQGETQSGISIYNNLSYNNAFGFQALPYNGYKTFSLINNTFYNNASGGIGIYDSGWYQVGCVIRNNIIVGNKGSSVPLLQYAAYPTGITMDHNLFYDSLGYNSVNKYGTSYIQANPLLTSPATDFSLQASSPAINAGSATYAPSVDYAGNARPQSSSYDIGAYEYVSRNPVLDHIILSPSTLAIAARGTQIYTAQGYDINNNPISGLTYTWSVTNPAAGSINSSGLFTAGTTASSYSNVIQAATGGKVGTAAVTIIQQQYEQGDINMDGTVDVLDMILVGQHQGESGVPGWIREDVNADGVVNVLDSIITGQHFTN